MRPIFAFCVLSGLVAGISGVAAEAPRTGGGGPAVLGDNNQVIVNGIDPRALKRLNDLLDAKSWASTQKLRGADEWADKYRELDKQLTESRANADKDAAALIETAQEALHAGKFEEAGAIYDRLIALDAPDINRLAQDHFNRAQILALQFRPLDALPHYAKAYQYKPDRIEYAGGYASILTTETQIKEAEAVLDGFLRSQRALMAKDPAAYGPGLARTLNDLGLVYHNTRRSPQAESALKEALSIRRSLAAQDPAAYRHDLAYTLSNLGHVYARMQRFGEEEAMYAESVRILRDLAAENPVGYRFSLANALNNLGSAQRATRRFADAESAYEEAATILRDLAAQNPAAYQPDLAKTLNNLANIYRILHRPSEAESVDKEALAVRRELAAQRPGRLQMRPGQSPLRSQNPAQSNMPQ